MWKVIAIPLLLYALFVWYDQTPMANAHERPAELITDSLISNAASIPDSSKQLMAAAPKKDPFLNNLFKHCSEDSLKAYIQQHAKLAVAEMHRAKIPASITLAQAILESHYGTSALAQHANNHFGIKITPEQDTTAKHCLYSYEWIASKKRSVLVLSCFRSYQNVAGSFASHSDFLSQRPYYTALFDLELKDFQGWAKGLQKAGYATDPGYAQKLIGLIQRYQLDQYDHYTDTTQQVLPSTII